MLKLVKVAMLLSLISFMTSVKAALLVEPVLGYNLGTDLDFGSNEYSGNGSAFGGRLGYQQLGFQLGVDYLRSSLNMDDSDFDEDLTTNEWAGFVGFEFPIFVRVYAGYIFSSQGESENNNQDIDFKDGTGSKLGIGFTGLPFVDINFEYRKVKYDEVKVGSVTSNDDADYQTYMVSLSLPFNF
jgi:hypothetical protein